MADTISSRSDFNVEQLADVDAAQFVTLRSAADELAAEQVRRACAELEQICAGLTGQERDELRDRIDRIQTQLASGVSPAQLLAVAVASARTEAQGYAQTEAVKTQAAIYEGIALSAEAEARASRRANQQFEALDGDIVVTATRRQIAEAFASEELEDYPPALRTEIVNDSAEVLGSDYMMPQLQTLQEEKQRDPERVQRVLEDAERRREQFRQLADTETDPAKRRILEDMISSNAWRMPSSDKVLQAYTAGASASELEHAAEDANQQVQHTLTGIMPTLRQVNARELEAVVSHAPEEQRERLRTDDREMARYLREKNRGITDDDFKGAMSRLHASNNDFSRLSERDKEVIGTRTIMATASASMGVQGALMGLGRAQELTQRRDRGEALSEQEIGQVQNLEFIATQSNDLLERSQRLVESTTRNASADQPGATRFMQRMVTQNVPSNTALSAITLAYADQHGGINEFQRHAASPESAESRQYFANYQNYLSQSLIGEPYRPNDEVQAAKLALALQTTGEDMLAGRIVVSSNGNGLEVRDQYGYEIRNAVYESSNFIGNYLGYEQLNDNLYKKEGSQIIAETPMAEAAALLDGYRLYNTRDGQTLIDDMSAGRISGEMARERAIELAQQSNNQMQFIAPSVLEKIRTNDPERYALMQANGLIDADGNFVIGEVMLGSLRADAKYDNDKVNDFRNKTDAEVREYDRLNPPAEGDISYYEARVMRQAAAQLQAANTLQQVRDLGTKIAEIDPESLNPALAAQYARDTQTFQTLMNPQEHSPEEVNQALRAVLQQDKYLGDASREKLLGKTADMLQEYLNENPGFFAAESSATVTPALYAQTPAAPTPTTTPSVAETEQTPQPATPATLQEVKGPSQPVKLDAREKEGSSGALDDLHKSDLEKAILGAVQNLSAETRQQMLGGLEAIKAVEAKTKNNTDFVSYNEIEKALKNAGFKNVQQIDRNGDGQLSVEEITSALTTPAKPATAATPNAQAPAPAAPAETIAPTAAASQMPTAITGGETVVGNEVPPPTATPAGQQDPTKTVAPAR